MAIYFQEECLFLCCRRLPGVWWESRILLAWFRLLTTFTKWSLWLEQKKPAFLQILPGSYLAYAIFCKLLVITCVHHSAGTGYGSTLASDGAILPGLSPCTICSWIYQLCSMFRQISKPTVSQLRGLNGFTVPRLLHQASKTIACS